MSNQSPIHVHVKDNTPVHLHVKKTKPGRNENKKSFPGSHHSNRATAKSRAKAINGPWIPAPGKTSTRDRNAYKWDTARSQLEIRNHEDDEALRMDDLSNDEEERIRTHIQNYEKKIEDLMSQVGTLKNEGSHLQDKLLLMTQTKLRCSPGQTPYFADGLPHVKTTNDVVEHLTALKSCMKDVSLQQERKIAPKCCKQIEKKKACKFEKSVQNNIGCYETIDGKIIPELVADNKDSARVDFRKIWQESDNSKDESETIEENSQDKLQQNNNENIPKMFAEKENKETIQSRKTEVNSNPVLSVELQKVEKELHEKSIELQVSKTSLQQQKREMESVNHDLEATERENLRLLRSMEMNQSGSRSDRRLMKALIEVEMLGQTATQQINVVRGMMHNIDPCKPEPADLASMSKERETLMQKFTAFEVANRDLRLLLQDEKDTAAEIQQLNDQRDTMMRKVSEADREISKLKKDAFDNRGSLDQVVDQLEEEKKHAHTLTELNKSIDATRAHLQRELRAKEMENNRLHVQLTNMEKDSVSMRRECEDEIHAARLAQQAIASEKEALKRATRAQKTRADNAENDLREVQTKHADTQMQTKEAKEDVETWKSRYHRSMDERARTDTQCKNLQSKLDDIQHNRTRSEKDAHNRERELTEQLHRLTSENSTNRLDAERMRGELATANEKLRKLEDEVTLRRSEGKQWETLTSDLRSSIAKHKNEAEEALLTAEKVERDARRMRNEGADEIEKVRKQMLDRMRDLHPLPDLLKETEMKLQDCQEQLIVYERRTKEQSRTIAELNAKLEDQSDNSDGLRQKMSALTDENRALEARLEIFRTKLDDRDQNMRESAIDRMNKDEDIQSLQLKYQEKIHEVNSLQRQLDNAHADVRKVGEMERDNAAARERVAQSRIVDLETQITRLKTDVVHLKKSKEDVDRKTQSQLHDMQDRLQQSESTNRSMRNYVSFLKSSYTSVFGDSNSPLKGGPTSPL